MTIQFVIQFFILLPRGSGLTVGVCLLCSTVSRSSNPEGTKAQATAWLSGYLFSFVLCHLIIFTLLFIPSSVSMSYFILAVPMQKHLGKHLCMCSTFHIAIMNGTFALIAQLKQRYDLEPGAVKQNSK